MVSMAANTRMKSGTSAFSQVPVSSDDKQSSHPIAIIETSPSSRSAIMSSQDRLPNYTVHTGRSNVNSNGLSSINNFEKQDLRVRQNFGKDQGYIPPISTVTPTGDGQHQSFRHRHMIVHTSRQSYREGPEPQEHSNEKSELPFDVLNKAIIHDRSLGVMRSPQHPQTPPVTRRTTSSTTPLEKKIGPPTHLLDPERGSFTMPPLKVSKPTPLPRAEDVILQTTSSRDQTTNSERRLEIPRTPSPRDDPPVRVTPSTTNTTTPTSVPTPPILRSAPVANNVSQDKRQRREDAQHHDEDSIFDFEEEVRPQFPQPQYKPIKITHKFRNRNRVKPTQELEDTSIENSAPVKRPSPVTLQERAAEAWKVRRAARNSSLRSKDTPSNKASNVSFAKESDTVHHFEPESMSEQDDEDEDTLPSVSGRSLNSEYTKTLESEVEDMIKDILFIGNGQTSVPGRRKLKHKPDIKRRLRKKRSVEARVEREKNADDAEQNVPASTQKVQVKVYPDEQDRGIASKASNEAVRGARNSDAQSGTGTSLSNSTTTQDDMDPFGAIWGFVEGGMSAMSTALGLDEVPAKSKQTKSASKRRNSQSTKQGDSSSDLKGSDCTDLLFGDGACTGGLGGKRSAPDSNNMDGMASYVQDQWYSDLATGSGSSYENYSETSRSQEEDEGIERLPFDHKSMDRDPRLIHLALQAAKSLHQIKGLQYDESIPVDMFSDVKMSIVELKLPLGLIFLENDGGCFVTKVAPDGSAARSGGVEVGDQLACINGVISLNMKVGDICKAIPNVPNQKIVELGLLRYVGPLRPSNRNSSWDSYDVLEANETLKTSFEGQEVLARVPKKPGKEVKSKRRFRFFGRGKKRG